MRFGFVTCVQLGLAVMEEIYSVGGRLDVVLTLPDGQATSKSGRAYLDHFCQRHEVPLIKCQSINDETAIMSVKERQLDWLFVIGWSQIVGSEMLATPTQGCIGMHPTLLPEGRGRASIPWAILRGLKSTGVTMFRLDEGVDTGDVLGQVAFPLGENSTATDVYGKVIEAHRQLIRGNWEALSSGALKGLPQDEAVATYWAGRRPEDGEILRSMTVNEALTLVRATTHPYPGAFWREGGHLIRVWSATRSSDSYGCAFRCMDGWIRAIDFEAESI